MVAHLWAAISDKDNISFKKTNVLIWILINSDYLMGIVVYFEFGDIIKCDDEVKYNLFN